MRASIGFIATYFLLGLIAAFGFGPAQGTRGGGITSGSDATLGAVTATSVTTTGDVVVGGSLDVSGNATVDGDATIGDDATVTGELTVSGTGTSTVAGTLTVGGHTLRDNGAVFEVTSAASHSTTVTSTAGSLLLKSQSAIALQDTAGGYTVPVFMPTGSAAAPGIAFGADSNSGFWSSTGDVFNAAVGGATITTWYRNGTDYRFQSPVGAHLLGFSRSVADYTADDTMNQTFDPFQIHTNLGTTAVVTFTLPGAAQYGTNYTFFVADADGIRVDPGANDKILDADLSGLVDGEYITSSTIGASVTVVAGTNGDWMVIEKRGTWTEETP